MYFLYVYRWTARDAETAVCGALAMRFKLSQQLLRIHHLTLPSSIATHQKRMVAAELRGQVIAVYKGIVPTLSLSMERGSRRR